MSTLSESLRLFFEGWVPQLCLRYNRFRQGEEDRLYLIYAGGDDMFVVGAWSALPELAKQIRHDFREFVGGGHVTLSGGIAIEHQKFPLYQLAGDAKYALDDQAKEFRRPDERHPKDALCFLGTPIGWEGFDEVMYWKEKLLKMLKGEGGVTLLPRSFLTRLTEIHALYTDNAMYRRKLHRRDTMDLTQMGEMIEYDKWRWRLTYQISRFGERYPHFAESINQLQQAIVRKEDGLIRLLHVLARWTELLTRER
jgi:CRISPR-associated protein Csm1